MFEKLGHYNILDRIGAGGMGEVYRARDTRLGRTVAIKVLTASLAADPERRERLLREANAAAALSHPNIAALYEAGEDQGRLFLVFEFVPGETLKNAIAGSPMNPRRALDLAVQIADALADAHAEGIVHRDIKPDNIIVTPKGNAKILDFGLSAWTMGGAERHDAAHTPTEATGAGVLLGTIAYLSPEQALGEQVDYRTDIFSLGVVLFEMLTGKPPFTGTTSGALALQIVQAPAPVPSSLNHSVPPDLDRIVGKALAKSLEQRYESAATMAAELRAVAAMLDVRSETSEAQAPAATLPQRTSAAGWIAWVLILAALGAAAWFGRGVLEHVWRRTLGPAPSPVIAVLPLDLAAQDSAQMFFANGFTEDLIARLGQTPGLNVIGRSATRGYRGRSPGEVAKGLGAAAVLTGSVQPSTNAVKVSLELIDASDRTAIWSRQYTRDVKDIIGLQVQIAGEVARALSLKPQPTASTARAASRIVDRNAYALYLRGRQAASERHLPEAINLYEEAIAADTGLTEAFAGLADALRLQVALSDGPDAAMYRERLRAAAERAYALDPDLPQANVAIGLTRMPLADALKYMRRAVEIDPSYAEGYHLIGEQLQDLDPEQAMALFRKSLTLDSGLDVSHSALASTLTRLARYDEARAELTSIAHTGVAPVSGLVALTDLHSGRYAQAVSGLAAMPSVRSATSFWSLLVAALRLANRWDEAMAEALLMNGRFPQDCDARVMLAALRFEYREPAIAHKLADPVLAAVNLESPVPSDVRCGLRAAAALGDGLGAAALLDRIARQESLLRPFAAVVAGQSGTMVLDPRIYPWSVVAPEPAVRAARQRLDEAYARERDVARTALAGLP
jgi:TolB-like protein